MADWTIGLFQSDATRGLSGGGAPSVGLDADNPAYNYRLRRHSVPADIDLVADPGAMWRHGLLGHAQTDATGDEAPFTDVCIVLSADDQAVAQTKPGWAQTAAAAISKELAAWTTREGLRRRHPQRPFGVRFVRDGGPEMGEAAFGLVRGTFVTALVPNLYTTKGPQSADRIAIHVALPRGWDGWREVGKMTDDQALFTLGSHWLDNFSHPNLREAAIVRIAGEGELRAILHPDFQDDFQLVPTKTDSGPVLALAHRGQAIAWIAAVALAPTGPSAPKSKKPGAIRLDEVPAVAPPMLLDTIAAPGQLLAIAPPPFRLTALQERGALLQKVHFATFMLGYDVYIDRFGEITTSPDDVAAELRVRRKNVSIVARSDGLRVDGIDMEPGLEVPLEQDATIQLAGRTFEYRDLRTVEVDGWAYVGELRRPVASAYLEGTASFTIGRSRECRILLPDEPRNDNIHWKPGVADGATIRARTGDIPKSQFYTDSIMVATQHATLDLTGAGPAISCAARQCYVYIRRGETLLPMYPTASGTEPTRRALESGDEILVGNSVFQIRLPPQVAAPTLPAPPPFTAGAEAATPTPARPRPMLKLMDAEDAPSPGQEIELPPPTRAIDSLIDVPLAPPDDPPLPRALPTSSFDEGDEPPPPPPPDEVGVVEVSDRAARLALRAPVHLVVEGWQIRDGLVVGNHRGIDATLPERAEAGSRPPVDHLRFRLSSGAVQVEPLTDVLFDEQAASAPTTADGKVIDILRRDAKGAEDFSVRLRVEEQHGAPFAAVDVDDALAHALLSQGVPDGVDALIQMGRSRWQARWDGRMIRFSPVGERSSGVSIANPEGGWTPVAATPIQVAQGARLAVDGVVYRVVVG